MLLLPPRLVRIPADGAEGFCCGSGAPVGPRQRLASPLPWSIPVCSALCTQNKRVWFLRPRLIWTLAVEWRYYSVSLYMEFLYNDRFTIAVFLWTLLRIAWLYILLQKKNMFQVQGFLVGSYLMHEMIVFTWPFQTSFLISESVEISTSLLASSLGSYICKWYYILVLLGVGSLSILYIHISWPDDAMLTYNNIKNHST